MVSPNILFDNELFLVDLDSQERFRKREIIHPFISGKGC